MRPTIRAISPPIFAHERGGRPNTLPVWPLTSRRTTRSSAKRTGSTHTGASIRIWAMSARRALTSRSDCRSPGKIFVMRR
ncbi:hypothetical protein OV079_28765 [Nannocystis pusilla]|uniref:Uncharacterized protein n=1 Tax=Nannocystis pusilla TaxID=889268 RepID=A0A9X3ESS7_9BACT|nr:hypothetical protein [Nannocystis pusilla]MCY1009487.1 hypothetical protein [Nannocystis pusilla]